MRFGVLRAFALNRLKLWLLARPLAALPDRARILSPARGITSLKWNTQENISASHRLAGIRRTFIRGSCPVVAH